MLARVVRFSTHREPHQRKQEQRFGVEMIEMRDWHEGLRFVFDGPTYLSAKFYKELVAKML